MNPSRVFTPAGQVSWGGSCMALYNVESPGGYQLTGLTIPGVDILGSKPGYSLSRPWLFEDFDQLTFHEVEEAEYERQLKLFESGRYEYEWEEVVFDMEEHNQLLDATREEVKAMRKRQGEAQTKMVCMVWVIFFLGLLLLFSLFRFSWKHHGFVTVLQNPAPKHHVDDPRCIAPTRNRPPNPMDPRQSRRQNPRRSSRRITERYLSLLPFPSLSIPTPPLSFPSHLTPPPPNKQTPKSTPSRPRTTPTSGASTSTKVPTSPAPPNPSRCSKP